MKPEVIEFVFDCYTRGQQRSFTDSIDGVSYTPRQREVGSLSGEPGFSNNGTLGAHALGEEQMGLDSPHEPYHAPLDPQEEALCRNFGRQLSDMSDDFEVSRGVSVADGQTVVQFESRCKFVRSTDGNAELTVVRSGNLASELTVAWRTRDNTAKAGKHYVMAEGSVSFKPHETEKTINVQLLSGHEDNYINFKIDLQDSRFIGPIKTMNVNINDYENLSRQEQLTIRQIIEARIPSVPHVINKLSENVTVETFKTALLCLCGNASSLPYEIRAALDLLSYALPFEPREHLMPFVTQYFRTAPELGEMNVVQENADSDSSVNSMLSGNNSETSDDSDLD